MGILRVSGNARITGETKAVLEEFAAYAGRSPATVKLLWETWNKKK